MYRYRLWPLLHHLVMHPIAGVLWFFGLDAAAEAVHQWRAEVLEEED